MALDLPDLDPLHRRMDALEDGINMKSIRQLTHLASKLMQHVLEIPYAVCFFWCVPIPGATGQRASYLVHFHSF